MESLVDIILSVIPWFQHLADQAEILITAIPAWGLAASTFLILAVGGLYTLWHFGYLREIFGGGRDGDNW